MHERSSVGYNLPYIDEFLTPSVRALPRNRSEGRSKRVGPLCAGVYTVITFTFFLALVI